MYKFSHRLLAKFRRDEQGASAVEYAILVGVIGVTLSVGAKTFATGLSGVFTGLLVKLGIS